MVKIIDNSRQRRGIAGKIGRTSTVRSEIYYQASNGQTIHAGSDNGNNNALLSSGSANSLGENGKQVLQEALRGCFKDMATLESNVKIDSVEPLENAYANSDLCEKPPSKVGLTHTVPFHESAPTEASNCLSLSFDRDERDDWSISRNEPQQLTCEANDMQARSNANSS